MLERICYFGIDVFQFLPHSVDKGAFNTLSEPTNIYIPWMNEMEYVEGNNFVIFGTFTAFHNIDVCWIVYFLIG